MLAERNGIGTNRRYQGCWHSLQHQGSASGHTFWVIAAAHSAPGCGGHHNASTKAVHTCMEGLRRPAMDGGIVRTPGRSGIGSVVWCQGREHGSSSAAGYTVGRYVKALGVHSIAAQAGFCHGRACVLLGLPGTTLQLLGDCVACGLTTLALAPLGSMPHLRGAASSCVPASSGRRVAAMPLSEGSSCASLSVTTFWSGSLSKSSRLRPNGSGSSRTFLPNMLPTRRSMRSGS